MAKQHLPTTPSIAGLTERKADIALVNTSPVPSAWLAARDDQFAAFQLLGEAGANGAVSLTELGQAFAACVADGSVTPDNASDAYLAYCHAWNATMATKADHVRGDDKPTSKGTTFDQSLSQFATFGALGAVAQGIAADGTWSPIFYERIARIYRAIPIEDGRVESLYSAFVACNRLARDLTVNSRKAWDYPSLSDDAIKAACTKAKSEVTEFARVRKQLEAAMKAAKKFSAEMADEVGVAIKRCDAIWIDIDATRKGEKAAVVKLVHASQLRYEREAQERSAAALVAAE